MEGYVSGYTFYFSKAVIIGRDRRYGAGGVLRGDQNVLVYALNICGQRALDPATQSAPATATAWDYLLNAQDSLGATWKRCSFGTVSVNLAKSVIQPIDIDCSYGPPQYASALCRASLASSESAHPGRHAPVAGVTQMRTFCVATLRMQTKSLRSGVSMAQPSA